MKSQLKKGVMSEVIGVFVLILVISVLAGMTFLFVSNLKTQTAAAAPIADSVSVVNETLTSVTETGEYLSIYNLRDAACTVTQCINSTGSKIIATGNYTVTNCNVAFNPAGGGANEYNNTNWKCSYSYTFRPYTNAETSINATESAGSTVVTYLPLLFLAIIFGAILAVVLKIILPYINLGNQVGGF